MTLVGFSIGGGEVTCYFGRFGAECVSRAVLVSAVTSFSKTEDNSLWTSAKACLTVLPKAFKTTRITFLDGFDKRFVDCDKGDTAVSNSALTYTHTTASFASPRATVQCVKAFGGTDFRPDMSEITVPTLLVHGGADQLVPLEVSAEQAHKLI